MDLNSNRQKAHEKSFDSLQRIHAVIFALAIGEAVKRILTIDDSTHSVKLLYDYLPQFFTLLFTIVPFYHGIHRHFDDRYVFNKKPVVWKRFLFIELLVCLLTACVFFWLALAIKEEDFFYILTGMLAFNSVWGWIVWYFHGAGTWKWSTINIFTVAIFLSILFPSHLTVVHIDFVTALHMLPLVIIIGWDLFRFVWDRLRPLSRPEDFRRDGDIKPIHRATIIILSLITAAIIFVVWLFYLYSPVSWHSAFRRTAFLFVAGCRTIIDYFWRWNFYFPEIDGPGTETVVTAPPA